MNQAQYTGYRIVPKTIIDSFGNAHNFNVKFYDSARIAWDSLDKQTRLRVIHHGINSAGIPFLVSVGRYADQEGDTKPNSEFQKKVEAYDQMVVSMSYMEICEKLPYRIIQQIDAGLRDQGIRYENDSFTRMSLDE